MINIRKTFYNKLLFSLTLLTTIITPSQTKATNKILFAIMATGMAANFLSSCSSVSCAWYKNPDLATQSFICKGTSVLNFATFVMLLIGTCIYCKKQSTRKIKVPRLAVASLPTQSGSLAERLMNNEVKECENV